MTTDDQETFDELAAAHGFERVRGIRGATLYRDENGDTYDRDAVAYRLKGPGAGV